MGTITRNIGFDEQSFVNTVGEVQGNFLETQGSGGTYACIKRYRSHEGTVSSKGSFIEKVNLSERETKNKSNCPNSQ